MSFAINAAPYDSGISFKSKNKNKPMKDLQKLVKEKSQKVENNVKPIMEEEDEQLENFEPMKHPEIMNETNRGLQSENQDISDFSSNPYLISEEVMKNINKNDNVRNDIVRKREYKINENNLDKKLSYLIELMEKQNKQNVEYLTEEIVLYGFFGIFVIYVIDSFTKVGKYVR